jgi:hypothetical protein
LGARLDAHSSPDRQHNRSRDPRHLAKPLKKRDWSKNGVKRNRALHRGVADAGRAALDALYARAPVEWQQINQGWSGRYGSWFRNRVREYVNIHGYVSAGVTAMLLRCAASHADADYLRAIGYATNDHTLVIKAQSFAQSAKSLELAAYEIACREGRAKRDTDALKETSGGKLARALAERPTDIEVSGSSETQGWGGTRVGDDAPPFEPAPGGVDGQGPHSAPTPSNENPDEP